MTDRRQRHLKEKISTNRKNNPVTYFSGKMIKDTSFCQILPGSAIYIKCSTSVAFIAIYVKCCTDITSTFSLLYLSHDLMPKYFRKIEINVTTKSTFPALTSLTVAAIYNIYHIPYIWYMPPRDLKGRTTKTHMYLFINTSMCATFI